MITNIQVNHMHEPIGFDMADCRISFVIEKLIHETVQGKQLVIRKANDIVYDSGVMPFDTNYFDVTMNFLPRTTYEADIKIITNKQSDSAVTYFETGKLNEPIVADWIGNSDETIQNTLFKKEIHVDEIPSSARLYMTGLGVYEAYLDGKKISNEFLAPGVTAYDELIQLQTYNVTDELTVGKHELLISVGDGWYKGRYGFDGGTDKIYGDQQRMIAELYLKDQQGHEQLIKSDESWLTTTGQVTHSSIYYGEDLDETIAVENWQPVVLLDYPKDKLVDRQSLPLCEHEQLSVKEIIKTPAGETVFDFGQNHAGWMNFYNRQPKGTKITFETGELLQNGNFYRDNLREARSAFTYISDGEEKWIRPHFTYFGYRYVKVTGDIMPLKSSDLISSVIYSDIKQTGQINTDKERVNRLFSNILWSQKSNFFDVPTDCPQRDERLGWTGDADIFVNTAAFNMDVFQFFKKYMKDISIEQKRFDGMVPMYAPAMGMKDGGTAVWGDAATIIPWRMYQVYGDTAILRQNYDAMVSWILWIKAHSTTDYLWTGTFQFGDWLALDGENPALPTGKTEEDFIASIYYYYSTLIVAKTTEILFTKDQATQYYKMATDILSAIRAEYITPTGRLAIDTQTAYAIALCFDIMPEEFISRTVESLAKRIHKDNDHLTTGFVGTAFVNKALSQNGYHELAVTLFLQEDYPSWLYAVNMGATTVWERWNSVQPDGSMNPEGMNSLNHYSIGAIQEWGYRYLLGIGNETAGFKTFDFAPQFDPRFKKINGYYDTPYGKFAVDYQLETDTDHTILVQLQIPYGVTVTVKLPRATNVMVNASKYSENIQLTGGNYQIKYVPTENYIAHYKASTPVKEIMSDEFVVAKIDAIDDVLNFFRADTEALDAGLGKMSLRELDTMLPFINISAENLQKMEKALEETILLYER